MSSSTETPVRDVFIKCLTEQLAEFELLKSMYPNKEDIILTDMSILDEFNSFLANESNFKPRHLDYTVNLYVHNLKLEVCINLPTLYPEEEPDIYVRCNQLNRQQESLLNSELSSYVKNNHIIGDVCLYTAICWLQDNIDTYAIVNNNTELQQCEEEKTCNEDQYVRLFVYSHHIYNKKKREEIVKKAKELKLTGFCLPGKPGIICIEGLEADCNEWWKDIKSMCWKKIVIRKTEVLESLELAKFSNFEEINLSKHEFSKFMEQHSITQAFIEVLGLGALGNQKLI